MKSVLSKMTRDELPNNGLKEIADVIGINKVKEMLVKLPGCTFHIPKTLYKKQDSEYLNTHPNATIKEVSEALGVSVRTAYRKSPNKRCTFLKLSKSDVKGIRGLLNLGLSQRLIALKYGVSQQNISRIKIGIIWKNLAKTIQ